MKAVLSDRAIESLKDAPRNVQGSFEKQLRFLMNNLLHPSLHAKKYDESQDLWQARVNKDWRFYFTIADDTYRIEKIIPHPKN
jgi:mRNA-degrading endonuclease RelE of RelBE toxin-antitoxin system